MARTATSQNLEPNEVLGMPLVCVRLDESFDRVAALNPGLRLEQNATGEIILLSPTGGESGRRNSQLCFQLESWAVVLGGCCFDSSTLFQLPLCLRDIEKVSDEAVLPGFTLDLCGIWPKSV